MSECRFDHLVLRIRDQAGTNSCVGQSIASAVEVRRALDGRPAERLSALSLYYDARAYNRFENEDAGAFIRSGCYVAHKLGVASEDMWPFDTANVNRPPTRAADIDALTRADGVYERIAGIGAARAEAVLDALQERCPVVFGALITDRFRDHGTAEVIAVPGVDEDYVGGHAMALVGFDRGGERVRVLNSWGIEWADGGFGWLATEWLALPTTADIWALRPRTEARHAA